MTGKKVDYQIEFEQISDKKEIERRLNRAYDILFNYLENIVGREGVNQND